MTKTKVSKEFEEQELPYLVLKSLYKNSRASLRNLGREMGVSYHVISKIREELEEKYKIRYTLELDETKLGFAEGRLITLKFSTMPDIDFLKQTFQKDVLVQDAYIAEGSFDLLLYVVGLTPAEFQQWKWRTRLALSKFKPILKFATIDYKTKGFLPIRSEIIKESSVLSPTEKKVLTLLNENSRIRLTDLSERSRISPFKIIYIIKKLRNRGIIKRFCALTQNPEKKVFVGFGMNIVPIKDHKSLWDKFKKVLLEENLHESVNDYCFLADANGHWDSFSICAFSDGETLLKRGPTLFKQLWSVEEPEIEEGILIGVITGLWPFHLEDYTHLMEY